MKRYLSTLSCRKDIDLGCIHLCYNKTLKFNDLKEVNNKFGKKRIINGTCKHTIVT